MIIFVSTQMNMLMMAGLKLNTKFKKYRIDGCAVAQHIKKFTVDDKVKLFFSKTSLWVRIFKIRLWRARFSFIAPQASEYSGALNIDVDRVIRCDVVIQNMHNPSPRNKMLEVRT